MKYYKCVISTPYFLEGELITEKERLKYGDKFKSGNFEPVEISKSYTIKLGNKRFYCRKEPIL